VPAAVDSGSVLEQGNSGRVLELADWALTSIVPDVERPLITGGGRSRAQLSRAPTLARG
jgi:hypothetical protein